MKPTNLSVYNHLISREEGRAARSLCALQPGQRQRGQGRLHQSSRHAWGCHLHRRPERPRS